MLTLGSGIIQAAPWYPGGAISAPQSVVLGTATTGGALSNGTYYVQVTGYNASGEGTPSAEQVIVLNGGTATQTITVSFAAPAQGTPTGYRVYISQVSGYEILQGSTATTSYTQTTALTTSGAQARFVGLQTIGEVGGDVEFDIQWSSKDFYGQSTFPISRAFYGGKATVKAKKVELYVPNLQIVASQAVWSQGGAPGSGTDIYGFTNTTSPQFLYVVFTHTRSDAPTKTVQVQAYKATSANLQQYFIREDISTVEVDFELVYDSSISKLLTVQATQ